MNFVRMLLMSGSHQNSNGDSARAESRVFEHAVVDNEDLTIQSISEVVYPLFNVEGGALKMAGCSIDEIPILKIKAATGSSPIYIGDDGPFDADWVRSLKLDQATPAAREPEWLRSPSKKDQLDRMLAGANSFLDGKKIKPQTQMIVWCKHVDGKLAIEFDHDTRFVKFSGWVQRFVDGLEKCPPYFCQLTGKSSYAVMTDDEGTITVLPAIGVCEITGKRLVETRLGTCSVSGKQVQLEKLWTCPISDDRLLEDEAIRCRSCNQKVSPPTLANGRCLVCRQLVVAEENDPAVELVKSNCRQLKTAKSFKQSSCRGYTVVVCRLKWSRYLLVIDNESNDLIECRKSGLIGRSWQSLGVDAVA